MMMSITVDQFERFACLARSITWPAYMSWTLDCGFEHAEFSILNRRSEKRFGCALTREALGEKSDREALALLERGIAMAATQEPG